MKGGTRGPATPSAARSSVRRATKVPARPALGSHCQSVNEEGALVTPRKPLTAARSSHRSFLLLTLCSFCAMRASVAQDSDKSFIELSLCTRVSGPWLPADAILNQAQQSLFLLFGSVHYAANSVRHKCRSNVFEHRASSAGLLCFNRGSRQRISSTGAPDRGPRSGRRPFRIREATNTAEDEHLATIAADNRPRKHVQAGARIERASQRVAEKHRREAADAVALAGPARMVRPPSQHFGWSSPPLAT